MKLSTILKVDELYTIDELGRMQGTYSYFHDRSTSKLWSQCNYVDGIKQGEEKIWYDNGQLKIRAWYVNDMMNGEYKRWYATGVLGWHCFYLNDNVHGEAKHWNDDGWNGILHTHAIYLHGEISVINPSTLSGKDKLVLSLKHEIQWL